MTDAQSSSSRQVSLIRLATVILASFFLAIYGAWLLVPHMHPPAYEARFWLSSVMILFGCGLLLIVCHSEKTGELHSIAGPLTPKDGLAVWIGFQFAWAFLGWLSISMGVILWM